MSAARQKDVGAMSYEEISAVLEHMNGLQPPSRDAPRSDFYEYVVAANILVSMRETDDPDVAKRSGIEFLLQYWGKGLEELVPAMEMALGRKLLQAEIEGCTIYD